MPEKGPPVFLDYDQAALDAAYDQGAYAPNREQLIKKGEGGHKSDETTPCTPKKNPIRACPNRPESRATAG